MLLSNRRIKGRYVDHPLGKDSNIKKLSDEVLLIFVEKIRQGVLTREERNELIKSFICLAINIAGRYGNLKPYLIDDLVSEGIKGIIYAIDKAHEKLNDTNLCAWVTANIHRFISKMVLEDDLVPIPTQTRYRAKLKGEKIKHLSQESLQPQSAQISPHGLVDLKDAIYACATDAIDKLIIDLRIQGFNDVEIAGFLKSGQSMVSKRRASIEQKYIKNGNRK